MAAIATLLGLISEFALEFLVGLSLLSPPEKSEMRDQWTGLAVLFILLGGVAVVVAMILSLSRFH